MTAPLSTPPTDSPTAAPSAEYYETLVTTPPAPKLLGRHLLLALALVLAGGEFLYARHVRANDALRAAVLARDTEQVRDLLRGGADPNLRYISVLNESPGLWRYVPGFRGEQPTDKSKTLLMMAASANYADVVEELLKYGANPNFKLANGHTALLAAAVTPQSGDAINMLLAKGADFRIHDSEGHSPLQLAARAGNEEGVVHLLVKGAAPEEQDAQGQNALCLASGGRHEDVVALFVADGANLNALENAHRERSPEEQAAYLRLPASFRQQQRVTPLLWAAQTGSPSLICAIWDKALDAQQRKTLGIVALTNAISSGSRDAVQALLDRGVPVNIPASADPRQASLYGYSTPLLAAAGMHNAALCRLLLDRGADVNRGCDLKYGGVTPLMAAATDTQGDLLPLLLERGAEVNTRNAQGLTPLMLACNSPAATQTLLAHGAKVNLRDNRGNTALMHSQSNEVMKLLLKAGADARNAETDSMLLVRASTPEVVDLLIANGAKVDERDSQGKTALMRTHSDDVIAALLKHGADINAKDNSGQTALNAAATQMSPERIRLLVAHGADVNVATPGGETALSIARRQRYQPVIDALVKAGATH